MLVYQRVCHLEEFHLSWDLMEKIMIHTGNKMMMNDDMGVSEKSWGIPSRHHRCFNTKSHGHP